MWHTQPPVGVSDIWHLDLPGMLWQAQGPWGSPLVCALLHYGQMEGDRTGENEGKDYKKGTHSFISG